MAPTLERRLRILARQDQPIRVVPVGMDSEITRQHDSDARAWAWGNDYPLDRFRVQAVHEYSAWGISRE